MENKTLTIPLLPLQEAVLLPVTYIPLHIFEPRYKEMMNDVLESDHLIGIAQLKPGWEADYYATPAIYKHVGIGTILSYKELEDGRFDLILEGVRRAYILSETQKGSYRLATVAILDDTISPEEEHQVDHNHQTLKRYLMEMAQTLPEGYTIVPHANIDALTPGELVDVFGSLIIDDPYERQSLLAEPSVLRRQKLISIQVKTFFEIKESPND